jgi:hypothetical protein
MSSDVNSNRTQSSCSETDDKNRSKFSTIDNDGDADESDDDNSRKTKKSRRIQKMRKTSNSSLQQKYENNNCKDEQQQSSSNEDEYKESNSNLNGINDRRIKCSLMKNSDHLTTTTTDDDLMKNCHCYHPLDNLESKLRTTTNESNLSSPIPTISVSSSQPSMKKINRFQIKSIRKSQQEILLANTIAAKSSNDDDCSASNQRSNSQLKSSIIERKNTNTPTTDGENTNTNTDSIVSNGVATSNTMENGHHRVRFHATPHGKQESATEEEKLPSQAVATVSLPATVPPSSTASVQGDVSILFDYNG